MNDDTCHDLVQLRPMPQDRFEVWLPAQTAAYAASKVRSGNWPAAGARERAEAETRALLPQGLATPGHLFFDVVDAADGGAVVGNLWVKTDAPVRGGDVFVYNIEIAESRRGRGYGSAALKALEAAMRAEGAARIQLHVFGFNTGAWRLYEALGFVVTNVSMAKPL